VIIGGDTYVGRERHFAFAPPLKCRIKAEQGDLNRKVAEIITEECVDEYGGRTANPETSRGCWREL
jgi:hypothetical protein